MAIDESHNTAPPDRVSWNQLIAFGMGGLVPVALFNIAPQLVSLLGNISLGLDALWLGAIMLIPRLWDAFSDPILGHLSDNTRTRWGRRRPFILVGGIAVALSFVAMWWVPRSDWVQEMFPTNAAFDWFLLGYILAGLLLFFTACTVFEIPHGALGLEMSGDYHERTRLFSSKSFFGNLFAMGTPWLFALANLSLFKGQGGDLIDGMQYVSMIIAAFLIPLSYWWFLTLREPGFVIVKDQKKTSLLHDLHNTLSNRTFLALVAIIFTLAMGFNFVQIFKLYITIFYVFGGDTVDAGWLLGVDGSIWAVTGLFAVFPLNWISNRIGKNRTLLLAIFLMCAAQFSKIYCYNPEFPYLILIPTVLLSTGMVMFFTLGASMVGDVCDEDELKTGTRSEGSFFSVFWWFIKLGSALAQFVMGVLLVYTGFDTRQSVATETLGGNIAVIKAEAEEWQKISVDIEKRTTKFDELLVKTKDELEELRGHFRKRLAASAGRQEHLNELIEESDAVLADITALQERSEELTANPEKVRQLATDLEQRLILLRHQTPTTLLRLRVIEIGLPLVLSCISILLTLRYPLTEARWQEIKAALDKRHSESPAT